MQFQVPQFIETEDKVVGPLSLRQFMYIGIGGLVCAVFYFFVQPWLFVIATIVIMGGVIAIAFIKVNGQPFTKILAAALNFYWKPQAYVWKPGTAPVVKRQAEPSGISLEAIASGMALHKSWENLQNGSPTPQRTSAAELVEKRMNQRYQILEKTTGDRQAAKRVDYR